MATALLPFLPPAQDAGLEAVLSVGEAVVLVASPPRSCPSPAPAPAVPAPAPSRPSAPAALLAQTPSPLFTPTQPCHSPSSSLLSVPPPLLLLLLVAGSLLEQILVLLLLLSRDVLLLHVLHLPGGPGEMDRHVAQYLNIS